MDSHEKQRKWTREEKEADEAKRTYEEAFKKMFNEAGKKKAKTGAAKSINLEPLNHLPMTPTELKRIGNPSDPKYQMYIKLRDLNQETKILPPSNEDLEKVDELRKKMDELKAMFPEPEGYISQMRVLKDQFDSINPTVVETQIRFADAVNAFRNAVYCRERSKQLNKLDDLEAWTDVVNALILLGVRDAVHNLREVQKENERLEREAEREAKRAAAAAQRAAVTNAELQVQDGAEAENNNNNENSNDITIRDSSGNYVPIGSLLQAGEKHARQRPIKQKKRTKWNGEISRTATLEIKDPYTCMSRFEFDNFISKPWTCKVTKKNGESFVRGGRDKKGHSLQYKDGKVFCNNCYKFVGKKFGQHLAGDKHWELFTKAKKKVVTSGRKEGETSKEADERILDQCIDELKKKQLEEDLAGLTVDNVVDKFRMQVYEIHLKSNMSDSMLETFKEALDLKGNPNLNLGNVRDLPRTIGRSLRKKQLKKIKWILDGCYSAFVSISDGSPLGANAEAIILRLVRISDNKIVEILISLQLFQATLKGEGIAVHLINELKRFGLDLEEWRASIMDRAKNNQKAIAEIREKSFYAPSFFPCFPHIFCGPGKEFKKICKEYYEFQKHLNTAIMFRGKLYIFAKESMNESPVIAGGVRWYLDWEQSVQLYGFGIRNIISTWVPYAEDKKLSEKSIVKLKKSYDTTPKLLKIEVQAATIAEIGREFCLATYLSEGEDPLTICVYTLLERIENFVRRGPHFPEESSTRKQCRRAAEEVAKERNPILAQIDAAETSINTLNAEKENLQASLEEAEGALADANGRSTSARGRRRNNQDFAALAGRRTSTVVDMQENVDKKREELEAKKKEIDEKKKELEEHEDELLELDGTFDGLISEDDFVDYCKDIAKVAFEKYEKMFADESIRKAQRAFIACKIFDILWLQDGHAVDVIKRHIDELKNFGFKEFCDPVFINGMKAEINELQELANNMQFDFETEPDPSELYTDRKLTRKRRAKKRHTLEMINNLYMENEGQGADNVIPDVREQMQHIENEADEMADGDFRNMSWKNDAGERGRRVYEWWRVLMNEKKTAIPHFQKAIRLIVLMQPSSASCERVFSQLTFIRRIVGDRILGEMLELRALIRCNNSLRDDFK